MSGWDTTTSRWDDRSRHHQHQQRQEQCHYGDGVNRGLGRSYDRHNDNNNDYRNNNNSSNNNNSNRTKKRKTDHQKLVEEKAHRLALEIDRDEKTKELEQATKTIEKDRDNKKKEIEQLKHINKDQYEMIQKQNEMIQKQNEMIHKFREDRIELLVRAEGVSELDSATVGRYKDAYIAYFNTAKKALRSLESKKDETRLVIETENPANLQNFFDEWYNEALHSNTARNKRNASLLFHGLDSAKEGKNFYGRRIVDEWDVRFQNAAIERGREDDTEGHDGPTREFLAQCWKQLGGLRVWKDTGDREEGVLLFETQDNGVVPIEDDTLRYKLERAFPDKSDYEEALDRAKSYYRAIGRIILHSLANGHTISALVMPPFYQNWLLRGCSPKDDDYHRDDVLKHLSESGTTKHAILGFVGLEWEFADGLTEIITEESVFTRLIPHQYIDSRKLAFKAVKEGLTLDGDYSLSEFLRSFPLEAVQKIAFSSPHLQPGDVIAILKPMYCHDWKDDSQEKTAHQDKQKTFFKEVLCKHIIRRGNSSSRYYDPEFLSLFVKFCTGLDYLPDPDGNPDFKITVEFNFGKGEKNCYPKAYTCCNTLKLPGLLYTNGKIFREKFDDAVCLFHDILF